MFRLICWVLVLTFGGETIGMDAARAWSIPTQAIVMPPPGTLMSPSQDFSLPVLKAIAIDPNDPFKLNFVVNTPDTSLINNSDPQQFNILIRYFLGFLAIPEEDLWVNLSPYEKEHIIPADFEDTDAGRDMLEQDYVLKQLASSLTYPDQELGKAFWKEVFARAKAKYGTTQVPINSFNKVWVVPDQSVVYEDKGSAFIGQSRLKVLVEEDYLSLKKHSPGLQKSLAHEPKVDYLSSDVTRQIIIPELEREVNEGKYFASLRQMYNSLILAIWFKKRLREHLLNQVYVDRKKISGIALNETQIKERIYAQYLRAFKKGAYNFIREDYDDSSHEVVPRKYFSGGFSFADTPQHVRFLPAFLMQRDPAQLSRIMGQGLNRLTVALNPIGLSRKILRSLWSGAPVAAGALAGIMAGGTASGQSIPSTAPASTSNRVPFIQTANSFYQGSENIRPILVEGRLKAGAKGIVTGLDLDKKEYKAGEPVCSLMDPQLNAAVDALRADLKVSEKKLADLKELAAQGGASFKEVTLAQQDVINTRQKLAQADQKATVMVVLAPQDMTVEESVAANGMQVTDGMELLKYFDKQRVQININIPTVLNYFGDIRTLKINGHNVESIVSAQWTLGPSEKYAQLSLIVDIPSSILPPGRKTRVEYSFLPPAVHDQTLKSIQGQAHAIGRVRKVEQYSVKATGGGRVRFLVKEGDSVQEDQVVAVIENKHYREEYDAIVMDINNVEKQLNMATDTDGTLLINRDEIDRLIKQRSALLAQRNSLLKQIDLMNIKAHAGTVQEIAAYESRICQTGDELLRIGTGKVFLGSVNDPKEFILFPQDIEIKPGDPVMVETPQGLRFPGVVSAVNNNPNDPSRDLSRYQAAVIMVSQPGRVELQPGLPVMVTIPKQEERPDIIGALKAADKKIGTAETQEQHPLAELHGIEAMVLPVQAASANMGLVPATQPSLSQPSLTIADVEKLVAGNELVTGAQTMELLQKKAAESFPEASRLSFQGGVYLQGSKIVYTGGLVGTLTDAVKGGVSKGDAISAGIGLAFTLAGNVTDLLSGKVAKEKALAVKTTEIAYHHMVGTLYHAVKNAEDLFFDIGEAQQEIQQLDQLINDLEKTRQVMISREAGGFSLKVDRDKLENTMEDLKERKAALEKQKQEWTVSFNALTRHTPMIMANTDLSKPVTPNLPWSTGYYTSIDTAEENRMREQLLGANSWNPRIMEVKAADEAVQMAIKLQRLKRLPMLNLGNVFISDGRGLNPFYDISEPLMPDSMGERSSNIKQGANPVGTIRIDLVNTRLNTEDKIIGAELQKSKLNIDAARSEVLQEFQQAVGDIRQLSLEITRMQKSRLNAIAVWQAKVKRPDVYLPQDLVADRLEILKMEMELYGLKRRYLQAESTLNQLRLNRTPRTPAIAPQDKTFSQAVADALAAGLPVNLQMTFPPLPPPASQPGPLHTGNLRIADMQYDVNDPAYVWALMKGHAASGAVLDNLKDILINGSDIFQVHQALDRLLQEHQNDRQFYPALKDIVLRSSNPDVVWALLEFMGQKKDHGLPFLVEVVQEASSRNTAAVDLTFKLLDHILTLNPEVCDHLTPSDFSNVDTSLYPQVSPQAANKFFVSYLFQNPDAVGAENLTLSTYWTTDDFGKIYRELMDYVNSHPQEKGADDLRKLALKFKNWGKRKEALSNGEDNFRLGSFEHLGNIALDSDIFNAVYVPVLKRWNERFLYISPHWSEAGLLYSKLNERAEEGIEQSIQEAAGSASILNANSGDYPIYNVPPAAGHNEMAYFFALGLKEQKALIPRLNVEDLVTILQYPADRVPLRAAILDNIMKRQDLQGRMLVLGAYLRLKDKDPDFKTLIESQEWAEILKEDVKKINNAANMRILRSALEALSAAKPWAGNLLVETYPVLELAQADVPQTEDQIKKKGTSVARAFYDEKLQYLWVLRAGATKLTAAQIDMLKQLDDRLAAETDPHVVNEWLESQFANTRDLKVKKMLGTIISVRDKVAQKIRTNDQTISEIPLWDILTLGGLAVLGILALLKSGIGYVLRRRGSIEDRIKRVSIDAMGPNYKPKNNGNGNGNNHAMLSRKEPARRASLDIVPATNKEFETWERTLARIKENNDLRTEGLLDELNTIQNKMDRIFLMLPYSSELMMASQGKKANNTLYLTSLNYFNSLTLTTIRALSLYLKDQKLSPLQCRKLKIEIKLMFDKLDYSTRYARILNRRGNIEGRMSYKYPDRYFVEWSRIYPLIRVFYGYSALILFSKTGIHHELPALLDAGEELYPGLYKNKQAIVQESEARLARVISQAKSYRADQTHTGRLAYKAQNFFRRSLGFTGLVFEVWCLVCAFLGIPFILPIPTSIGIATLALTMYFFWSTPIKDLRLGTDWNYVSIMNDLKKGFPGIISPKEIDRKMGQQERDREIMSIADAEGDAALKEEINSPEPMLDAIVIVPELAANASHIEEFVQRQRQEGHIRPDVPVIVIPSQYQGSENVYLDPLNRVGQQYNAQYPQARPWDDSRVAWIFDGEDSSKRPEIQDQLLQKAYKNAVRIVRKKDSDGKVRHRAGHILINSRAPYDGEPPDSPDTGLVVVATKVDRETLKTTSWIGTRNKEGKNEILDIRDNMDVEKLEHDEGEDEEGKDDLYEETTFHYVRKNYLLTAPHLRQYPGEGEIYVLGRDVVEIASAIAQNREKESQITGRNKWAALRRNLVDDFFLPLVMIKRMRNAKKDKNTTRGLLLRYANERHQWKDLGPSEDWVAGEMSLRQSDVERDYDLILNSSYNTGIGNITAFIPHLGSEVQFRFTQSTAAAEVERYRMMTADQAQAAAGLPVRRGGIDFSQVKGSILFKETADVPAPPGQAVPSLQSFHGFSFQIIQYQSISNPAEFFLGSAGKNGPWFTA